MTIPHSLPQDFTNLTPHAQVQVASRLEGGDADLDKEGGAAKNFVLRNLISSQIKLNNAQKIVTSATIVDLQTNQFLFNAEENREHLPLA